MNDINQIVIGGNLTRDPDYKDLEGKARIAKMTVAVNRRSYKDCTRHDDTWFFRVEAWDTLADKCHKYLTKGRAVRVVGHLKQETWIDKCQIKHEQVSIVAEHIEFGPGPKQQPAPEPDVYTAPTAAPAATAAAAPAQTAPAQPQEGILSGEPDKEIESDVPEENGASPC